ncbi:hypothetical protein C8R47DRAFT_1277083 [Mycena vitilis]|nr:hypothetical protein C8R47DRAFT_1277083 [Mycena vitilis]
MSRGVCGGITPKKRQRRVKWGGKGWVCQGPQVLLSCKDTESYGREPRPEMRNLHAMKPLDGATEAGRERKKDDSVMFNCGSIIARAELYAITRLCLGGVARQEGDEQVGFPIDNPSLQVESCAAKDGVQRRKNKENFVSSFRQRCATLELGGWQRHGERKIQPGRNTDKDDVELRQSTDRDKVRVGYNTDKDLQCHAHTDATASLTGPYCAVMPAISFIFGGIVPCSQSNWN